MLKYLFISIFLWGIVLNAFSQTNPTPKTRILFLLDGSGSMLANWEGKLRIDIAREILSDIVDSLQNHKNVELALRVYGHRMDKDKQDCHDTQLEVPFQTNNHAIIKDKLQKIKPKGVTPLAYSLEQAARDFTTDENYRNVIIIITDGIESCDGNPCKIAYELQKRNIFLKPFVIGIGIEKQFDYQLDCIGKYYNANNKFAFQSILNTVLKQSLTISSVQVDLLDIHNQATETNINISFVNAVTQKVMYNFIHFQNEKGVSDKLKIDPLVTYDLIVHTTPKVIKKNIQLEAGENIIRVKSPQGSLAFDAQGYPKFSNLMAVISDKEHSIINHLPVHDIDKLLVGSYTIDVLTLPRITFTNVKIEQSETTSLHIPTPGALSIPEDIPGYGSLYVIKGENEEWFYNFKENSSRAHLNIQPGTYKLVFRAKNAQGSEHTYVKKFTIQSGSTTTLKLFK